MMMITVLLITPALAQSSQHVFRQTPPDYVFRGDLNQDEEDVHPLGFLELGTLVTMEVKWSPGGNEVCFGLVGGTNFYRTGGYAQEEEEIWKDGYHFFRIKNKGASTISYVASIWLDGEKEGTYNTLHNMRMCHDRV
jgi:hypothetical protein